MSDSLTDITAVLCTYYNHLCGSLSPWLLAIFLITINTASVSLLETAERLAYPLEITVAGQIIFFPPSTISSTSTERLDQTNTISKTANRGKFNLCSFCVWYPRDYLFLQFQKKEKKYSKALSCGIKLSDQQQDMGGKELQPGLKKSSVGWLLRL